jgi:hypothetical protein
MVGGETMKKLKNGEWKKKQQTGEVGMDKDLWKNIRPEGMG